MEGRNHLADRDAGIPRSVGAGPSDSTSGFKPSTKLRDRIERLAPYRINPSSITFMEDARESCGGHATVSPGWMDIQGVDMRDMEKRASAKRLDLEARDWFLNRRRERMKLWRGMNIAVKRMRIADDVDLERVLGLAIREAEFLAELHHPNIVDLEGFAEDLSKSIVWLVFPWAYYGNLKDFVGSQNWEIPERISLINDVIQGLAYLHNQEPPICHGDLKSLNVLVDGSCHAKITDFGSARRLPKRDLSMGIHQVERQPQSIKPLSVTFCASTNTITLTHNNYTIRWAAPELLNEDELSLWSDIWALGWIAYEVMTNFLPFQDASSDAVVIERVLAGKLPSLADNAHLSLLHELCALMNMCWKINPAERPTANFCLEFIRQMPMFTPGMGDYGRFLNRQRLTELGRMYQSRGKYARASRFFVKALEERRGNDDPQQLLSSVRELVQVHRLRKEYRQAITLHSSLWKIYAECMEKYPEEIANSLRDLVKLRRLRNRYKPYNHHFRFQYILAEESVASSLCTIAQQHSIRDEYDEAVPFYSLAFRIWTDVGNVEDRRLPLSGLAAAFRHRGEYEKAISLYSKALRLCISFGEREGRAAVLCGLADVHRLRGKYCKAISLYSRAFRIWTNLGHRECRASAMRGLADVHRQRGEYDEAIPLYRDILSTWMTFWRRRLPYISFFSLSGVNSSLGEYEWDMSEGPGTKCAASACYGLADVFRLRAEYDKAIVFYSQALQMWTDLGAGQARTLALAGLADVRRQQGEYDKAIPLYSEALEVRTNFYDRKGRASALWGLAEVHRLREDYDSAKMLYSQALEIWTNLDDGKGRAEALFSLADVHRLRGEYDQAIPLYWEVLGLQTDLGDRKGGALALCGLANVHRQRGEYNCSIFLYSQALKLRTDLGNSEDRALALWGLADAHQHRGECDRATPLYLEALEIWTDIGDRKGRAKALCGLSSVHLHRGEYDEVIPLCSEVLEIRTELGDRKGRAEALWDLAEAHRLQGDDEEALRLSAEALKIRADFGDTEKASKVAGRIGNKETTMAAA